MNKIIVLFCDIVAMTTQMSVLFLKFKNQKYILSIEVALIYEGMLLLCRIINITNVKIRGFSYYYSRSSNKGNIKNSDTG